MGQNIGICLVCWKPQISRLGICHCICKPSKKGAIHVRRLFRGRRWIYAQLSHSVLLLTFQVTLQEALATGLSRDIWCLRCVLRGSSLSTAGPLSPASTR